MARRTLGGRRGGRRDRPAHGPRGHGPLLRRARRARASSSGGRTSPGAPTIPARIAEVQSTERRTALGQGEAVGADRGAPARRGGRARARRPDGRARRARAADRRRVVHPVSRRRCSDAGIAEHAGRAGGVPGAWRRSSSPRATRATSWRPAPALRLTTTIEWAHPLIGRQTGAYDITPDEFARELAGARTFGFLREADALRARGLALGAALDSTLVLSEDGLVGGATLRWPDEFVRHKAADILGDLALVGGRVQAHVIATKPSHQGNIALARWLTRTAQRDGGVAMDIGRILDVIPHRYPFLLVDRILEVEGTKRIVGIKNVTINEPFFQGHFPGPSDHARRPHHRGDGAGGRHAAARHDRGSGPEGGLLHVARQREVPPAGAAGRPAPLRARDAAEPRPHLPDEGHRLRGRQRRLRRRR